MNHPFNLKAIFSALAGLFLALPAAGQLHEQISVDGRYVPDVIRIDRINAFPKALKATLAVSPLNYESKGVAASFTPSLVILPATGWRSTREISDNPGYLELGAGSWLNSTLSAGYRFIDNQNTLFGIRLQHNSTSLWKPNISEMTADTKQFRYDEMVGLYASQVIKGHGRLDASLDYHFGRFNYYGFGGVVGTPNSRYDLVLPAQTINDVAFRVDWRSLVNPSTRLTWSASARMRHFGYRHMLLPFEEVYKKKGAGETNIGLEGGMKLPWDNGSSIGIDGDLDLIFLSKKNMEEYDIFVDNYGMLTLTPYYRFSKGLLDIRLGADVDLSFNAGEKGNRYSFIHVAPDVRFGVQTGQVGIYLDVLGGSELMTLARLHQLDYYGMPALTSTRPTFSPLDAAFGVNVGPISGFSLGLKARYKVIQNVPLGGWYMYWLNSSSMSYKPDHVMSEVGYVDAFQSDINLHGYSVTGHIGYEYGKTFGISAEGSVQPQNGKKGFFNGYDRAKITGTAKMYVRPVKPLKLGVSYDFRGKRDIYYQEVNYDWLLSSTVIEGDFRKLCSVRLKDITLLNFSASYDISDSFSLWLQADNLLDRHDAILPGQPTQGIVVVGGFKWLF